ncbi:MAG TPA: hypothetical protein VF520_10025 [Thermoleophilaceae bacterium]|jgi:acyl-coenzyme A thioesterase PaaI-like protein
MADENVPSPDSAMWDLSEAELRASFYDFPNIPMHKYLGMTFERDPDPDGPAVVRLPPAPEFTADGGRQSVAAVYTVAEVSGGIAVSDAVVPAAIDMGLRPVVLTKGATFSPVAPAQGEIRAVCEVAGDEEASLARLRKRKRAEIDIAAKVYDDRDELVGESVLHYYVRLMDESRLKAMAAMSPGMAGL